MISVLSMWTRAERKHRTAGADPAHNPPSRKDHRPDATRMGGPRGLCFSDDRVDGECKKDRTQGISLLDPPGADEDVRSDVVGASEEGALGAVSAVDAWGEGWEMSADHLQDRWAVHRVECVEDIHREGDLARVRVVAVKPLGEATGARHGWWLRIHSAS